MTAKHAFRFIYSFTNVALVAPLPGTALPGCLGGKREKISIAAVGRFGLRRSARFGEQSARQQDVENSRTIVAGLVCVVGGDQEENIRRSPQCQCMAYANRMSRKARTLSAVLVWSGFVTFPAIFGNRG